MMRLLALAVCLTATCVVPACAQSSSLSNGPDLSGYATKDAITALQAVMPAPATTVPPTESPQGAPGTAGTYRPGNAVQPRITRSKTLTLDANGTATFDWTSQGALTPPVQVAITPIYTGSSVPKCWATATSATSASVKCVMETVSLLTVATVQVGSVNNASASGLSVGMIVLPPS